MTVWFVERPVAEMKPPRFTQAHPGETPLNRIPDRASSNVTPGVTNPGIAGRGDHNSAAQKLSFFSRCASISFRSRHTGCSFFSDINCS